MLITTPLTFNDQKSRINPISLSLPYCNIPHTHTHTHTHIYIYIDWRWEECSLYSDSLRAVRSGVRTLVGKRFSAHIQTGPKANQRPVQWIPVPSPGIKRAGREVKHSLSPSVPLRMGRPTLPQSLYVFKLWTRTVLCFIHIKCNALKDTRTNKVKWKDNLNTTASFKSKTNPKEELRNEFTYLLTYLLAPWCRVLLEKLTGLQLVKKLLAFLGTRRFVTALTSVRHLSLT